MVVPSAQKASSTVSPRPAMAAAIASKLVIRGRSFGCSMPSSLRLTAMICLYLGSARSRRSRCPPTSPVAPARRAVRCDDASVMIEPLKSAGHVEGGSHRKGRPGRGEPIEPLDWLRLLPHAAAASSDRLGWVGLEAARCRATLAFELNVPVLTHHQLFLFACPPEEGPNPIGGLAAGPKAVLERMEARLAARPAILKQRREIAEHPFGSIKQWMNQGTFLLRGLEKVRAEFSLTALAYNFIRVVNIVGVASLLKAV